MDSAVPTSEGLARASRRRTLPVVLGYALLAALWIYGSDLALEWLVADPQQRTTVSMVKGWTFVAITSALLYWLLRSLHTARARHAEQDARLHTLALLNSAADGSTDDIFARDLQGRFLMRNRASLQALPFKAGGGNSLDDLSLSPAEKAQLRANDERVVREDRTLTFSETYTSTAGTRTFRPNCNGRRRGPSSRSRSWDCWRPTSRACSATGTANCTAVSPTPNTRAGTA